MDSPNEPFNILPMVNRVFAKTLSQDLVNMDFFGITPDMREQVKRINRDRKIEAVTEDKPYEEMRVEDLPEYRGPSGKLFYLDYSYGGTSTPPPPASNASGSSTRRPGWNPAIKR